MAYHDDIQALTPEHHWAFDGDYTDDDNSAVGNLPANAQQTSTGQSFEAPICEGSTASWQCDGRTTNTQCADASDMNSGQEQRRCMGGWIMTNSIQKPPTGIYKEGGGTNNIAMMMGFGNNMIAQAVDAGDFDIQCFSNRPITPNRAYHVLFRFEGTNFSNEFALFVDGVKQSQTEPSPPTPDRTVMGSHSGDICWGDPDSNLNVGGGTVSFIGPEWLRYAQWASWSERSVTDQEIRDVLFERGALPTHTVTNQAQLDALANSTISETPLAIRVDVAGSIALNADNITFDEASIHVQYTGTGTLTWTNESGSNAAISSVTNGGTVVIQSTRALGFVVNDEFGNAVSDYEWRLYIDDPAAGLIGTTELAGEENRATNTGSYSYNYISDQPAVFQVIKTGYEENLTELTLGGADQVITASLVTEENI